MLPSIYYKQINFLVCGKKNFFGGGLEIGSCKVANTVSLL